MPLRALAVGIALLLTACAAQAQDFTFDASEFEKKPFEFSGYVELKLQHFRLNQDSALYKLGFYKQPRDSLDQTTLTLKPEGKLPSGALTLNARAHREGDWATQGFDREFRFDEFYGSYKPDPGLTLDAGKIALKWGKGYGAPGRGDRRSGGFLGGEGADPGPLRLRGESSLAVVTAPPGSVAAVA